MKPLLLRIFTHPACSSCPETVRRVWEIRERHPEQAELRTVTLETREGLAEAHAAEVLTIPTVILSIAGEERHRIVGTPAPTQLEDLVERLLKEVRGT